MNKKKLLALLMALVMTLTLVPVTAWAEGEPEATLTHGGTTTGYTTAQEALDRAVDGDTVTLYTGNHGTLYLRQNSYVSVGVDVRQQAGEYYGTNDRYRALNGVTIQGNTGATLERIVFEAGAHYGTTHSNPEYSTTLDSFMEIDNLTISGLTFNITGPAALDFSENLRITGLNVTNCTVNGTGNFGGAERLLYGTLQSKHLTSKENSTLTGVTKTDVDYTTGLSNLSVTNCTFNNLHQVMEIRNVSGLTFTGNAINHTASHALLCVSDSNNPNSLMGTVTVSGNTANQVGDRFFRTDKMKDATVTLTNNTITNSGKESRVNGNDASLVAMDNGDNVTYTVSGNSWNGGTDAQTVGNTALFRADPAVVLTPAPVAAVVRNSETIDSYTTLQDAIDAAVTGDTVTLQTDCSMASKVEINKNITLDLNGNAITSDQDDLFTVMESGTLTINDSVGGGSISTDNWTVLNAKGGTIIVNAGKITATKANTAYKSNNGSITFYGGMINQLDTYYTIGEGRIIYAGYGENAGCYIIAEPTVTAVTPNAVEFAPNSTEQQQLTATAVANTTLVWTSSDETVATVDNGLVTPVGPGTATIYAADAATGSYAYATVTVGNASYKNLTKDTTYASLQVAVNEADSEDTIQVLDDVTLSAVTTFPADKALTLDLNNHTITENSNDACLLKNNGTLTITGGTIRNGNDETDLNNSKGLVENHGTLTVSGTFYDYGQGGGGTLLNLEGSLTVKTGTVIQGYGEGSGNATINSKADLVIEDGVTLQNRSTDEIVTRGYGVYCVSIDGGEATIGMPGAANPTTVTGYRGAVGINGGKLTINSGTFTGTKYRDLWITNDGDNTSVTINGGTFSGSVESILAAVDDGRQDASNVALTINGGYFNKGVARGSTLTQKQWNIAIKGGFYKVAPNDKLVAEGYAKAELTNSNSAYAEGYRYQVGKVKTSAPTVSGETTIETQIANNQITYTVKTDVVDDKNDDALIQNIETAQALTVSGTTTGTYSAVVTASDGTSAVGAVALGQLDEDKIGEIVQAAVNSAGVDAGDANSISVVLVSDGGTTNAQTNPTKITYEVHPEAIVYKTVNNSETAIGSYAIKNEELGDTTFTFKLAVGTLASVGGKVNVTHKHNGTSENLGAFTVDGDGNITITGIKSFSEFELASVGDVTATCQGASLRRRVLTIDHNTVVNTSTDYRVTFDWTDSSSNTVDVSQSKLQWSNDGGHSWHTVAINNTGTVSGATRASVVITGIPSSAFSTTINTRLCLKNSSGGEILTVNGPSYSVRDVADKLSKLTGDDNAQWRDYGDWLLGNRTIPLYIVNN